MLVGRASLPQPQHDRSAQVIPGVGGRSRALARNRDHDDPSWPRGFHSASRSHRAADGHLSTREFITDGLRTQGGLRETDPR
jgi:hypothetical protein